MKPIILAAVLLPSILLAQVPQSPPPLPVNQFRPRIVQPAAGDALPDNYQVSLTITDKDGTPQEVSIVIASAQFSASLGEQSLTFSGTMTVENAGSAVIAYALGWQTPVTTGGSTVYQSSSTQGSVRLKLGEEVQIIRAGNRTAKLSVKKLESVKAK